MWSFFIDLIRSTGAEHTVLLMDADDVGKARRYRLRPSRVMWAWGGSILAAGLIVGGLVFFTPLRTQIPGYGTEAIEESARSNAEQLQALQDSLAAQRQYVNRLRLLITGRVDSVAQAGAGTRRPSPRGGPGGRAREAEAGLDRSVHEDPAIAPSVFATTGPGAAEGGNAVRGLSFPLPPPVTSGFPTREFDAETGHYGVDVAVPEGEHIHAVGDGYVVWAAWTQDGGYTIAVQHAGGYLSIYKHNKRLLKRRGERVRAQEPVAVSGNTGAITSGPHLHFELWRNGLAQGPASYIAEW
ncbi:MAG: M23 family metallopeptidase [Salinibacter sp.]